MKQICLVLILFLLTSCSDEPEIFQSSASGLSRIEIEPSLSSTRDIIMMVRADTQGTSNNGIYSAEISNPIRKEELLDENITATSIAPSGNVIAFLKSSKLYFYNKTLDSVYKANDTRSYQKLLFLTESIVLASTPMAIYSYNVATKSVQSTQAGYLPTIYENGTIALIGSSAATTHNIYLKSSSSIINIDVIHSTSPVSFGIEPSENRYCYSVKDGDKYIIYAGGSGSEADHEVAQSDYSGVVMLNSNSVIYTGSDGRLYESNYLGTASSPYWGNADGRE